MPLDKPEILVDFLHEPRFLCRQVHPGDTSKVRPAGAIGNVIMDVARRKIGLPRFSRLMGRRMEPVANFLVASPELF